MSEFLVMLGNAIVDAYHDCRTFSPGQWASVEAWFEHSGIVGYVTSGPRLCVAIAWAV